MKKSLIFSFCIIFTFFLVQNYLQAKEEENRIQVALLLDTSNSMDGLIEQAKTQLWKIVNELARSMRNGKPINLSVALYEYGKDSIPAEEGYLRIITSLTTDLDKISEELFNLTTYGGSEYCGKVIHSAVNSLQWSKNNTDLKIIVIAGNEPFTQGDVDYRGSCKSAISKGIIINTIFCGDYNEGIQTNWKDGADLADGKYMNIDQNQQIVHISAPQDDELVKLGMELNNTYIAYGAKGEELKERQEAQDKNSIALNDAVMVQRSVAKAGSQYRNESWDLVDADKEGVVEINKLDKDQLPEEMKKMTVEERKQYIEDMRNKRDDIQKKINDLNEARRKYIAQKMLEDQTNTLDAVLIKTVQDQAKKKNFVFD